MTFSATPITCPICEEGEFTPYSDGTFMFRHGKKTYAVSNQLYAKCNVCEVTGYLPNQRKLNFATIAEFQAKLEDYVSPSDVLAVRERYSLTQKQASQIFKGGVNGFSKWERGITFPSAATAMLIKVALSSPDAMRAMAKIARVDLVLTEEKLLLEKAALNVIYRDTIVCTHMEYHDDANVDVLDTDFEIEDKEEWTTQKSPQTTTSLSFLN